MLGLPFRKYDGLLSIAECLKLIEALSFSSGLESFLVLIGSFILFSSAVAAPKLFFHPKWEKPRLRIRFNLNRSRTRVVYLSAIAAMEVIWIPNRKAILFPTEGSFSRP